MEGTARSPDWLPAWIGELALPVWISDPRGKINYVNRRAETLLGVTAEDCRGRPCHEVIGGSDGSGRSICGPDCSVAVRARRHSEIEPFQLCVAGANGVRRWIRVLIITLRGVDDGRPWLVHCALSADKERRIERYLSRVAARTVQRQVESRVAQRLALTPREREILQRLAQDEDLRTIAEDLNVSYVTVRNHVQHLLEKLGVHSIIEAVACHLLLDDGSPPELRLR